MGASRYYVPSGKVPAKGVLYCLLCGGATAVVGGCMYAFLQWALPYKYFDAVFCIALGAGTGRVLAWAGYKGHVRHPYVLMLFGIFSGLLAWYVQWAGFVALYAAQQGKAGLLPYFIQTLLHPADMFAGILHWGQDSLERLRQSGGEDTAWLVHFLGWGLETLGIVAFAAGVAKGKRTIPYSEKMQCWMQEQRGRQALAVPTPVRPLYDDLERGSIRLLLACPHSLQTPCMRLSFHGCKGDDVMYLSLTAIIAEKRRGRLKIKEQAMLDHISITRAQAEELRNYLETPSCV